MRSSPSHTFWDSNTGVDPISRTPYCSTEGVRSVQTARLQAAIHDAVREQRIELVRTGRKPGEVAKGFGCHATNIMVGQKQAPSKRSSLEKANIAVSIVVARLAAGWIDAALVRHDFHCRIFERKDYYAMQQLLVWFIYRITAVRRSRLAVFLHRLSPLPSQRVDLKARAAGFGPSFVFGLAWPGVSRPCRAGPSCFASRRFAFRSWRAFLPDAFAPSGAARCSCPPGGRLAPSPPPCGWRLLKAAGQAWPDRLVAFGKGAINHRSLTPAT